MLDYARAGVAVVVTAIDRLGRSVAEVTRTIADLEERRILLRALRPKGVRFRDRDHHRMDLKLRRATDRDAVAVSALYLRARKAAKPTIPMTAHTDDETRRWIADRVVPHTELWVAEDDGGVLVGLLVLDQDRVDQLYVEPTLTGRGIGSELIGLAKRARPQGLRLWTFESNLGGATVL
jgi:hypothetical protein